MDVLAEAGTLSVAEIAVILGRPADALYFHLRALKLAGLVRQASYRYRGRLYAVTVLLTPLDHRRRGAKGNRKREQAGKK